MGLDGVELEPAGAQPRGDGAGDDVGVDVELEREQRIAVLVALADDARRAGGAVERLLQLALHERALLLHHQDLVEAVGELAHDLLLERPDHAQLEDADAREPVEAEVAQRVLGVVVGLAAGDDAQPGVALALDPVDAVLARVGERQVAADAEHAALHVERGGREQVAVGLVLVAEVGQHRGDAVGRHLGGPDRVGHARDDLEAGPQPRGARAGVGVQAEVDDLPRVAGEEDRHVEAREHRLGGARDRRGLAARVVAHDGEAAAGARDADEVAVAQRVGGAVEAGRLAVPHAEHAVVLGAGELRGQLAAPGRGGAELLVEARHVAHVVLVEQLAVALASSWSRPPSGRALVARDHRAGVEAARPSARCWSSTSRTSPCTPVSRTRPSSSTYLSSRLTSRPLRGAR